MRQMTIVRDEPSYLVLEPKKTVALPGILVGVLGAAVVVAAAVLWRSGPGVPWFGALIVALFGVLLLASGWMLRGQKWRIELDVSNEVLRFFGSREADAYALHLGERECSMGLPIIAQSLVRAVIVL